MPDYDAADGAGCRANGTLYYRRKILYSSFLPEMVMESGIFSFTVYCGSLMRSSYSSMRYGISYDVATYQVTESAKFPSPARAGKMIAGRLNKISSPDQTFGIAGGNWKCDSASVSWNGKYWIATLSYTKSGDDKGWDADLYGNKK